MRIQINAHAQGDNWAGPRGESNVSLDTEAADVDSLPWEAICANLVQSAIAKYRAACTEEETAPQAQEG